MSNPRRTPDTDPSFVPPRCPNSSCAFHLNPENFPWIKAGFYTRRSDHQRFQAYRCRACKRTFSTRTFCCDYWLRRRELLQPVANLSANGTGLRQAARVLGTSHTTIARHLARLGRHCLLFQEQLCRGLSLCEPVAFDGFESFEHSQFFPFHLNLAAGQTSWFVYRFSESPLRRKGRMTVEQRRRRAELEAGFGRPDPKAIETGVADLIASLLEQIPCGGDLYLSSDEHPAYPRALQRVRRENARKVRIRHQRISSKEARTIHNPLFSVNLFDLLLRHSNANHRRETIAFSKRRQAAIERASILVVWRNAIKRRRENGADRTTAAMFVGALRRPLEWFDVLRRRLFPAVVRLRSWQEDFYWRRVRTRVLGERQTRHRLTRAF